MITIKKLVKWTWALIFTVLIISMLFSLSSCMTTKTAVGGFKEAKGIEYTYSKSKQTWLFYGLIPLGRTNTATPANGQCEIIVRKNVIDIIVSYCTGGFFKSQTVKVIAKK